MRIGSLTRGWLLGGASVAAMVMGSGLRGAQAGTTLTGTFPAGITLPATDFVFIDNATVTGNVTNSSTLGIAPEIALEVSGGSISGGVTNASGATISASEVGIYIHDAADIANGITNNGDINVTNTGTGVQSFATPVAGVWISSAADTSLNNTGNINVMSSRIGGGGSSALAFAGGIGIGQTPFFTINGTGDVTITNSGDISVLARASAAPFAQAGALGIIEVASNTTATSLDIELSNAADATISVKAQATASETAGAGVIGILQGSFGANNVSIDLTNDGSIEIAAQAKASGTTAQAIALVGGGVFGFGGGVFQSAGASGSDGDTASVSLTNTSFLTLDIIATATATGNIANASAIVNSAIDQFAFGAEDSSVTLENSGALNIVASARATAVSTASAFANVTNDAIEQNAVGLDTADSFASVSITNEGNLNVQSLAFGKGMIATAIASFGTDVIDQEAHDGFTASASIANATTGTFEIVAQATASATTGAAKATATFHSTVVDQSVEATNDVGSSAIASFTNDGSFSIRASAEAQGGRTATAVATFSDPVIYQDVADGDTAQALISNTSTFEIVADASAVARSGKAVATASFYYTPIEQAVTATNNVGSTAVASLSNEGTLSIHALAYAKGTEASASAIFSDYGIYQNVEDGYDSNAVISNTSTFEMMAQATAIATVGAAVAIGILSDSVIYQAVSGTSDVGGTSTASVTNDGTFNLLALAHAQGRTAASAFATFDEEVIYQEVDGGFTSLAQISNTSTLQIIARATALATGTGGAAKATASYTEAAIYQTVSATNDVNSEASAEIANDGTLNIQALAFASGAGAAALATFTSDAIVQTVDDAYIGEATISNSSTGTLDILAQATAIADEGAAIASAYLYTVVSQSVSATDDTGSIATASMTNDGTFNIQVLAKALGQTAATAIATMDTALGQDLEEAYTAQAQISNASTGTIDILAQATATALAGPAKATASFEYTVISQSVTATGDAGSTATASITNEGSFNIHANAKADGQLAASAFAQFSDTGIHQDVSDAQTADAAISNTSTGTLDVLAQATATASSAGAALASAVGSSYVIYQTVSATGDTGSSATATLTNAGTLSIAALADASGATATAIARFSDYAIYQNVLEAETALATVDNSGSMALLADASAVGFVASAQATMDGVQQTVQAITGGSATASFSNSSSFEVAAVAVALGQHRSQTAISATATATAEARGVRQNIVDGDVTTVNADFNNSGSFTVKATATASASAGTAANTSNAYAYARGYRVFSDVEGFTANLGITNSGDMIINALALVGGAGSATASARGIILDAETLTGSFVNSGNLTVMASAPDGSALVRGLDIRADEASGGSFENTGSIYVAAIGATAEAIAVRFRSYTATGTGTGTNTPSFTNDGGTIAAWVTSSGTLDYGFAFMTEHPTYAVQLNWRGSSADGSISGHVEIKDGDMIHVTGGTTWFDGAINPTVDDNVGTLDIFDSGKLILALNEDRGPNSSYVDTFAVQSDGTIGFEILGGSTDISRIDAITANLDGTIMVTALAGLYSNTQTYQDVIDADTRNGTFATESLPNTPLLDLAVVYDGSDNVDLTVTRVAFDDVDGLTINQKSVASGIETTYSTLLADQTSYADYTDLIGELFTLDDTDYPNALDQLSGVEYAGTLQAALGSFRYFLNAVQDRTDNPPDEGTSTSAFLNPLFAGDAGGNGRRSVWASVQGGHGDQDGDGNASGYSYNQVTALFGIDAMVNERLLIGAAGGLYAPGDIDFDNGNTVNQDTGYQIGAYAKYDTGSFYARGFVGYGAWDASATRTISIGTLSGTNTASFDVDAWNVTGEIGHKFNQARFDLTPFAGLSYTRASVGNYVETGFAASALSGSGDDDQVDGYLGVRISGVSIKRERTTILPELAVGYVHNFSDEASVTNTLINAPLGTGFTIVGPEHGGAGFVDFSTTVVMGDRVSLSFGYLGEFGSDHQDHSGYGKFKVNF